MPALFRALLLPYLIALWVAGHLVLPKAALRSDAHPEPPNEPQLRLIGGATDFVKDFAWVMI